MMKLISTIFILSFINHQSFQIEDTRNKQPPISISQYKENYLQCNNVNSIYPNRNWFPQMKVLDESQDNMTTVIGRFVKVHKPGRLIVLCYIETDGTENDAFISIIKVYHITNSTEGEKDGPAKIKLVKFTNLEMKELLPAAEPDSVEISVDFDPQINTTIIQNVNNNNNHMTVSCSHIYSINERRDLQLLRILSNGTKLSIKLNPMKLSASFVDENYLMMMKYNHDFIYNHRDYFNNSFECRSVDKFTSSYKSKFTTSIKVVRKCLAENLEIKVAPNFSINDKADKYLEDYNKLFECSCEGSYPTAKIKWTDSHGIKSAGKYLPMNVMNKLSEPYCCVVNQIVEELHTARACVNRKNSNSDAWIVIQRRINGAVPFARTWTEYKNGFGHLNGDYWLGNDKLHQLTSAASMKIRFDLWDKDDIYAYAEYSSFSVASESDNYRLSISGYSGTAGDSMNYQNNMQFSTKDRDNDNSYLHCSQRYGYGGWWYKSCEKCNLNGQYLTAGADNPTGVIWYHWKNDYKSMKKTIIKIAYKY